MPELIGGMGNIQEYYVSMLFSFDFYVDFEDDAVHTACVGNRTDGQEAPH